VEYLSTVHLQNGGGHEDAEGGGETDLVVMVLSWTMAFNGVVVVGTGRNNGSCCNSSSPLCRDTTLLLFLMVFSVFPSFFLSLMFCSLCFALNFHVSSSFSICFYFSSVVRLPQSSISFSLPLFPSFYSVLC